MQKCLTAGILYSDFRSIFFGKNLHIAELKKNHKQHWLVFKRHQQEYGGNLLTCKVSMLLALKILLEKYKEC